MVVLLGLDSQVKLKERSDSLPDKSHSLFRTGFNLAEGEPVGLGSWSGWADRVGISAFLQFVCVESLVTALVDMYPTIFRKKNRRETLILLVSILSYLVGLVMLTEVLWAQNHLHGLTGHSGIWWMVRSALGPRACC